MQVVSADDLAQRWGVPVSFVRHVLVSDQTRRARSQVFSAPQSLAANDILRLIAEARDSGDLDEAFWRAFLATQFGRLSADPSNPDHGETAGRFLNAFGDASFWTWKRVSADLSELALWLQGHQPELATLRFGNHRKFETKRSDGLWTVIASFVHWIERNGGGPSAALRVDEKTTSEERFDALYYRLEGVHRFGRTACFDLLLLLAEIRLLRVRPGSCYLIGATGPLRGAEKLWGSLPVAELAQIADDRAREWQVPFDVMEDALCIWQKG